MLNDIYGREYIFKMKNVFFFRDKRRKCIYNNLYISLKFNFSILLTIIYLRTS